MMLRFTVEGLAVPWQRTGGRGKSRFTRQDSRIWKSSVATMAGLSLTRSWPSPTRCARVLAPRTKASRACACGWCRLRIKIQMNFFFPDRRVRDIDNLIKNAMDAMTSILYRDDGQVDELHVYRIRDDPHPRAEFVVGTAGQDR